MTSTIDQQAEPVTRCGACNQADDHPKHQVYVGQGTLAGDPVHHPHDFDGDGSIYYHFDCPSDWHDLHNRLATQPFDSPDPAQPQLAWLEDDAAQQRAVADTHAAIVTEALNGRHGEDLRQWIVNLNQRGGAGGMDQTRATAVLAAYAINSSTSTVGSETITGPMHMRLMTANGSDSANGALPLNPAVLIKSPFCT